MFYFIADTVYIFSLIDWLLLGCSETYSALLKPLQINLERLIVQYTSLLQRAVTVLQSKPIHKSRTLALEDWLWLIIMYASWPRYYSKNFFHRSAIFPSVNLQSTTRSPPSFCCCLPHASSAFHQGLNPPDPKSFCVSRVCAFSSFSPCYVSGLYSIPGYMISTIVWPDQLFFQPQYCL